MNSRLRIALLSVSVLYPCGPASAQQAYSPLAPQQPVPYGQTTVLSPYLNLLNGGNPGVNYYNSVIPEQWRRYQMTRPLVLDFPRYDLTVDDRVNQDVLEKQLPPTGHPTGFLIYNAYYNNLPNQRSFIPYQPRPNPGSPYSR